MNNQGGCASASSARMEPVRFRPVNEHGGALYDLLLRALDDHQLAQTQLEWLLMSLGVRGVEIDTDPLGDSVYCGNAAAWEDVRSKHVSAFASEVLRFLFLWGSLEAAARLGGKPKSAPTRPWVAAKVDAVAEAGLLADCHRVAAQLKRALRSAHAHGVERGEYETSNNPRTGDAVRLAGAVRNSIAHGWSEFPSGSPPDPPEIEWSTQEAATEISVLTAARRAALMAMQILMLDVAVEPEQQPSFYDARLEDERRVKDALLDLHLAMGGPKEPMLPLQ